MNELVAEKLVKKYEIKIKDGLFKREYKVVEAVKGISITIPHGKIVGLLGVNGAGKTTTIRMLSAIVKPTSGALTIDGVDAVKNYMSVKNKLNLIIGGERNLYWRLTAKENLEYYGSLYGIKKDELHERIDYLLNIVGLTEFKDVPIERYSKGMKQRVQIARGLINNPDYLFMDEPTLGLDIIIANEMRGYIKKLAEDQNKGILLTTHYISEAEELCDYIYIIDRGVIIAEGTKQELRNILCYNQQLDIITGKLTEEFLRELEDEFQGEKVKLTYEEDNSNFKLKFVGNKEQWSGILNFMNKKNVSILDFETKEPDLENVLLAIIKDFRQKTPSEV
ncbi:ABC-2 type transport system ATP-binding protein [Hathewaya proteolytica DSM 3090]|uniref:ABC-2 type transport system ATP-binding protein n=1 Tax=Hathewaya proteolytica DSM 3090 TaxID=1121331 RepID=A0A1M6K580_9CLOT|nr:ABC transporter ATP-binding protein [Hathewaya proteolytica]SHJ54077.1 ABC-2 type transport system ATP-binding protein [Hathewaya proteolytica DSM 3090]